MRIISKNGGEFAIVTEEDENSPHRAVTWNLITQGDKTILEIRGDIDLSTVTELRAALEGGKNARAYILDLQGVAFMDSAGLALIVEARNAFPNKDAFSLAVRERSQPARILQLGQFDRFIPIQVVPRQIATDEAA